MNTEIRMNSKWEALRDFSIGIGSHSQNPNSTNLIIKRGSILVWDDDAPNGNVWFYVEIDGVKHRGKIESGSILNLINRDLIQLVDNGRGFVIYTEAYVKRYLND
jgi:hypothetical protein